MKSISPFQHGFITGVSYIVDPFAVRSGTESTQATLKNYGLNEELTQYQRGQKIGFNSMATSAVVVLLAVAVLLFIADLAVPAITLFAIWKVTVVGIAIYSIKYENHFVNLARA